MNEHYVNGFMAKCAEYGVDPEQVVKLANQSMGYGGMPGSSTAAGAMPGASGAASPVGGNVTGATPLPGQQHPMLNFAGVKGPFSAQAQNYSFGNFQAPQFPAASVQNQSMPSTPPGKPGVQV